MPPTGESLAGLVERVTYQSPDDGFCVLRVKVRGHRRLITIVGHALPVRAGEFLQAVGSWVNDRTHGLQFRATLIRPTLPTTRDGIEAYLGSGLVKGVGPAYARRLVEAFGEKALDVLDRSPERLADIAAIGAKQAQRIAAGWEERRAVQEIMTFLHEHGIGTAAAVRIHDAYGTDAIRLISEDPYRLVREIRCIGFAAADAMAEALGIERTALVRARAGVAHVLARAMDDGHCGLPRRHLVDRAVEQLGIHWDVIEQALDAELEAGGVVADRLDEEEGVFPALLYKAQQTIADRLAVLAAGRPPWPRLDPGQTVPAVEGRIGLALSDGQRAALRAALRAKLLVVTGGPGVGKTTLVNAILSALHPLGVRTALAAPTGRAAKRLAEATGLEAKTIHRLLEANPGSGGFRRDEEEPLDCDLLVIDETSMVDVLLMSALLRAVPDHAALVLVGDVDQLPSVGPGQVLRDIIGSAAMPTLRLTEIFRQARKSRILLNAHRINRGEMPDIAADSASDFHFVEARDPDDMVRKILAIVRERIPRRFGLDPIREVQVLCPMNRGGLGAQSLNVELQRALNPRGSGPCIERFGARLGVGDKVMQVENDYDKEVYNGEVGIVAGVDCGRGEVRIAFEGRSLTYETAELDELALAYAITIHKSQGSEYPAVVIPLSLQHRRMLHRNLIYTGITRGKRLVVMVGQPAALAAAVGTVQAGQRWSRLGDRLRRPE